MAISGRIGAARRQPAALLRRSIGHGDPRRHRRLPRFRLSLGIIIISLVFIALLPPIFFHFRLRRIHKLQLRKCGWLNDPPLVCAHGGDSTNAFPNSMAAYGLALRSKVDCIEIDVSRSNDGVLFALHDRDLQRITGNATSSELDVPCPQEFNDKKIPTIEDALKLISGSVRHVILDAKVGPPSYEKGLANDILSVVERARCKNCIIWAKSDTLARDVIKLSSNITVGYIVMIDPNTGVRSNLLRMKGAGVVGVYHLLIDETLVRILHRRKKKVFAWTVDDIDSMHKMLSDKVDAVVTSNPSLLQRIMYDIRTECLEEGFSLQG
ncbi:hypothetical protein K2173_007223 [Erythroxylum novogranatense]|uniref:glycerophosphodiester phosphodiesterase n=1 Tax=Erythroxylum novogranatense TaxID=1862640 RepID=A0AAV8SYN4_9ROSI|nr:hypothetical protein K2173_007223 [Erythroxylum novogranatense]